MVLAIAAAVSSTTAYAKNNESTERDRVAATELVHGLLSDKRYAYRTHVLNDELSSRVFDAYVERLDPNRELFTEADMQALAVHRFAFDEAIKKGTLTPVYAAADMWQRAHLARCELACMACGSGYAHKSCRHRKLRQHSAKRCRRV